MRARTTLLGLLVLSGSATIARAQMPGLGCSRVICLGVSGGLTLPAADLADFHDSGFHYDASLFLNLPGLPISIRPEFSLTQMKLKQPVTTPTETTDVTKMFAAIGNIELGLGGGLYVLAGGGILSTSAFGVTGGGVATEADSETKFTFDAGAGYRFKMGGIHGFLEARVGSASYDQGTFAFQKAAFIPITFGLVF
jgi:hypothetical protein